jgi:diguanylate cyclase (GGDEF)-like protein/PAS domain S-box-containing protein
MAEAKKQNRAAISPETRRIVDVCCSLVEATQDSIYVVDRRCRYLYINPHHQARLGVSPLHLTGKSYADYHSAEESNRFAQEVARVFETGASFQKEHHSERDGREFLQTFSPVMSTKAGNSKVTAVSVISKNITEWRLAEHLYTTLAEKSPIGIFIIQDQRFVWINRRFQDNTGYTARDILGADSLFMVHRDDREHVRQSALAMMRGEAVAPYEYRVVTKKGKILWYVGTVTSIEFKCRKATLGSQMDISQQKRAEDAVNQSEERSRSIVDNIADAYYEVDLRGNLLLFNEAYLKLFGYRRAEMLGLNFKRYVDKKHADIATRAFSQVFKTGKPVKKMEWEVLNKSGVPRQVELSVSLIRNAQGKAVGFRGIMSDITLRHKEEESIRNQAFHDHLTGLSNRILFYDRLNMAIKRAKRSHKWVGILMLDLDHFKDVNDRWGHAAGDALLKDVAERLLAIVRDTDTVARQGGDEFCIALPSLSSHHDMVQISEKIIEAFQRPFHLDAGTVIVTTSLGAALYPENGTDFSTLIQKADKAMYRAKNLGRNRYCFFEEPAPKRKKGN